MPHEYENMEKILFCCKYYTIHLLKSTHLHTIKMRIPILKFNKTENAFSPMLPEMLFDRNTNDKMLQTLIQCY